MKGKIKNMFDKLKKKLPAVNWYVHFWIFQFHIWNDKKGGVIEIMFCIEF